VGSVCESGIVIALWGSSDGSCGCVCIGLLEVVVSDRYAAADCAIADSSECFASPCATSSAFFYQYG